MMSIGSACSTLREGISVWADIPCFAKTYETSDVRLYHADSFELLQRAPPRSVDLVLTDLPYSAKTAKGARRLGPNGPEHLVEGHFGAFDLRTARRAMALCGRVARTWVVSFMDYRHAVALEHEPPWYLKHVRTGAWAKQNSAPQLTGDRPAQGWESFAVLHREQEKGEHMKWWGGGKHAIFRHATPAPVVDHAVDRAKSNPTAKPVAMMRELILMFTEPGALVLDPFCGSGAVVRAAKDLGRKVIGIDADVEYIDEAAKRAQQEVLPFVRR